MTKLPSSSLLSYLVACWSCWIPILSPVRVPHFPGPCHLLSCDEEDDDDDKDEDDDEDEKDEEDVEDDEHLP